MGTLKPGATYIHERVDKVVYAREFGADPSTRQVVGWDYDKDNPDFDPRIDNNKLIYNQVMEDRLWQEIRQEARTNSTLQKALDRAIMIYKLSKEKV
jgi:hypothetical protein